MEEVSNHEIRTHNYQYSLNLKLLFRLILLWNGAEVLADYEHTRNKHTASETEFTLYKLSYRTRNSYIQRHSVLY